MTLLMLFALAFIVPWWAVVLTGAASFTFILLRPSVRTLELMKSKDKGALPAEQGHEDRSDRAR